jgi:protein-tyrosine-phosphatase
VGDGAGAWRVLFVCSGNICRSPMAEGLALTYASRRGRAIEAKSAGTLGIVGRSADPYAMMVCQEIGVDIAGHQSQGLSSELIRWCDYAIVMEYAHAAFIRAKYPEVGEKLLLLGSFGGAMEIGDPIGGWKFQFRWSRDEIKKCVETFLDRIPAKKPERP